MAAYHVRRLASCFLWRRLRDLLRGLVAADQVHGLALWLRQRRLQQGLRRRGI